jgi:hypothetical protein
VAFWAVESELIRYETAALTGVFQLAVGLDEFGQFFPEVFVFRPQAQEVKTGYDVFRVYIRDLAEYIASRFEVVFLLVQTGQRETDREIFRIVAENIFI